MAAFFQEHLGAQVTLVKGSGGIFDVEVDGRRIFSKYQEGRFPEPEELLLRLKTQD